MVALVVVALLAGAARPQPVVTAVVDRTHVLVGDIITLTIRVRSDGSAPVEIDDPVVTGLEVRGTHEATEVRIVAGAPQRTVTRMLRLMADRAGTASIGTVRVRQGAEGAESDPIAITVVAPPTAESSGLTPRVQALLARIPSPTNDSSVTLNVLATPDTAIAGTQVDVIEVAWVPRALRAALRIPPVLTPPAVAGAWSYDQATPAGIAASRRIDGRWYDLFVGHQVVFPLTAGTLWIGQASVSYMLPVTTSLLSREVEHDVESDSVAVAVTAPPGVGVPATYDGAVGTGLTVDLATSKDDVGPGGAVTITVSLRGQGNVALWPEPRIAWPEALRVYPGDVNVDLDPRNGAIAGVKTFSYLAVADSAGTITIPGPHYAYFDPTSTRYETTTASAVRIVAPPSAVTTVPRPAPPALMVPRAPSLASRLMQVNRWAFVAVAVVPLLLWLSLIVRRRRTRGRRPVTTASAPTRHPLDGLGREFRATLAGLVPDAEYREGDGLADALRAAGVEAAVAQHVARVRDRLRNAVFGPGEPGDADELAAEVAEVLRALTGAAERRNRRAFLAGAGVLLMLCVSGSARAQQPVPTPEKLYQAGAFRAAADSFLARAHQTPEITAYWFNAGDALYRAGDDGGARAAWLRAARLAPRDASIRHALALVPTDPVSDALTWVSPLQPGELLAIGCAVWLLGWLTLATPVRRRWGAALLVVGAMSAAAGVGVERRYARPVAIVTADSTLLREAPLGVAHGTRALVAASAVRVLRVRGSWLLVRLTADSGWVPSASVARL